MPPFLKRRLIFLNILLLLLLVSCGGDNSDITRNSSTTTDTTSNTTNDANIIATDAFIVPDTHEDSSDYEWNSTDEVIVNFEGDAISVFGSGATPENGSLEITSAGTYRLTGVLDNGGVVVDAGKDALVRIILNGVDISHPSSAPINILSAEKTIIVLAENTSNTLTDTQKYVFESSDEDEPNAALFSKDDLTITGSGLLTVYANYNDGITSKDGLLINSGGITVIAADDGIRGKDYLVINSGFLTLETGGDGLKSDNDDDGEGYIAIDNGTFEIKAGADGMQASSNIEITDGIFNITTADGYTTSLSDDDTAKGIKAGVNIFIDGGDFTLNTADDAIHSNNGITLNNGIFSIKTGDDGIHADTELTINAGDLLVFKCYEGIESEIINIHGGNLNITSSDDGINVAGGVDSSGFPGPGGSPYNASHSSYMLNITAGYILVNAAGDGLDSNGSITMSGGTVIVNGPTESMNGALDYDGTFMISGGTLLAVGSSGMAEAPSSVSSQYWVGLRFNTVSAGELIHLESSAGETLFTFAPTKAYQSVVYSSPTLNSSESYDLYSGGTSTGTVADGLYTGGIYTGGTLMYTFSP